jgi:hypothetical protein
MTLNPSSGRELGLARFRGRRRVLLVFAPYRNDTRLQRQLSDIDASRDEIAEHDLTVVVASGDGGCTIDGKAASDAAADALRAELGISHDAFAIVLVGKDGTTKLHRTEFVTLPEIFDVIDAMPMRQEEIRRKQSGET